jgi:hypothetical protein
MHILQNPAVKRDSNEYAAQIEPHVAGGVFRRMEDSIQ